MLEKPLCGNGPELKSPVQRVVVPAHATHYLANGTVLPSTPDDTRRFVRRASNLQALLHIALAWQLADDAERSFIVPVTNISRAGACFLHHTQLYPDDRVILDFGSLRRIYEVARCRRLASECFEIGANVLDG